MKYRLSTIIGFCWNNILNVIYETFIRRVLKDFFSHTL